MIPTDTIPWADLAWRAMPLAAIFVGALVALLAAAFMRRDAASSRGIALFVLAVLGASFVLTWHGWLVPAAADGILAAFDRTASLAWLIILIITAFAVMLSHAYMPEGHHVPSEHYALMLFATLGACVMCLKGSLVVLIIGLEIAALSTYTLTGIMKYRIRCNEASLKFFVVGSFALAFTLMGTAYLFGAFGTLDLSRMGAVAGDLEAARRQFFLIGSGFLITGFGFKIASAPFHAWVPDVYDGAPTSITAFIAGALKVAAFVALIRLTQAAFVYMGAAWMTLSSAMAVATMLWGNLAAIAQDNIKRLLAYSSIAHAGYMMIALPVLGMSPDAAGAVMFYLAAYAFATAGAFAVVIALNEGHEEHTGIASMVGLGRRRPWLAAMLTLFLVSLAGIPPTFGFFAKYYLFLSAVRAGYSWLALVAVVNTAISLSFYLKPVMVMYLRDEGGPPRELVPAATSTSVIAVILLCAMATVFFGLMPTSLLAMIAASL